MMRAFSGWPSVLDDHGQRVGEDGRSFLEGDPMLAFVELGLARVPFAPHES